VAAYHGARAPVFLYPDGMRKPSQLDGKCVLITGAARGIGAGAARALAARGARVALVGLEPAHLREVAAGCGHGAVWYEADVTDASALAGAIDTAAAALGGLDAVFANAGIGSFQPLRTMDPAQLRRVFEVNTFGVFHTIRAALPHVIARQGYVLLNASVSAVSAIPGFGAYAPSKAAVEMMGDILRQEVRHLGVDVGVCYFSFTDTDLVRSSHVHPALRLLREHMPPPLRTDTPLSVVVDAVVRAVERREKRVVVPRSLRAILPMRWMLALTLPRAAAPLMPEVERLCAETDQRFGGSTPTTEDPEALLRHA